ncbi:MAG: hypothetical protein AAF320_04730, partial [Myxococcota bacterium]
MKKISFLFSLLEKVEKMYYTYSDEGNIMMRSKIILFFVLFVGAGCRGEKGPDDVVVESQGHGNNDLGQKTEQRNLPKAKAFAKDQSRSTKAGNGQKSPKGHKNSGVSTR